MQILTAQGEQPDPWPCASPSLSNQDIEAADGLLLVSLEQYDEHQQILVEHIKVKELQLGLVIEGDVNPEVLPKSFDHFTLIRIVFPSFNDGRGFSLAKLIRNQGGYQGLLWAENVICDNLWHLSQVGFSGYVLASGEDPEIGVELLKQIPLVNNDGNSVLLM